jgi:hypothetical protein
MARAAETRADGRAVKEDTLIRRWITLVELKVVKSGGDRRERRGGGRMARELLLVRPEIFRQVVGKN